MSIMAKLNDSDKDKAAAIVTQYDEDLAMPLLIDIARRKVEEAGQARPVDTMARQHQMAPILFIYRFSYR